MLVMQAKSHPGDREIAQLAARSISQIKAIIALLPPRSVEASRLFRLIWRIELTSRAILSEGESLANEVGRLQSAFLLRKGESASKPTPLPESILADIEALAEAADPIISLSIHEGSNG